MWVGGGRKNKRERDGEEEKENEERGNIDGRWVCIGVVFGEKGRVLCGNFDVEVRFEDV